MVIKRYGGSASKKMHFLSRGQKNAVVSGVAKLRSAIMANAHGWEG